MPVECLITFNWPCLSVVNQRLARSMKMLLDFAKGSVRARAKQTGMSNMSTNPAGQRVTIIHVERRARK
jgi:hypothetical protein